MNCALCNVEIAAQSAINGTMCARCGAYANATGRAPPVQDVLMVVPGGTETWRAPPGTPPPAPGATPETTLVEDVAKMLGEEPAAKKKSK